MSLVVSKEYRAIGGAYGHAAPPASCDTFSQLFHEQRHPVGLNHYLLDNCLRQGSVACYFLHHRFDMALCPEPTQRKLTQIRTCAPWRRELRAE